MRYSAVMNIDGVEYRPLTDVPTITVDGVVYIRADGGSEHSIRDSDGDWWDLVPGKTDKYAARSIEYGHLGFKSAEEIKKSFGEYGD